MFDGNKSLVAIRFGGYPETVLAMSDALFSGSKIALRLPKEKNETELTSFGGRYSRRLKAGDTASECVLKLNDDEKKTKIRTTSTFSARMKADFSQSLTVSCQCR